MRTIIGGSRNCGKTTELIKISAITGYPIVCRNKNMARLISDQARELDLDIPFPITYSELPLRRPQYESVLVDEVEYLLEDLIGRPVYMGTTTAEMKLLSEQTINRRES